MNMKTWKASYCAFGISPQCKVVRLSSCLRYVSAKSIRHFKETRTKHRPVSISLKLSSCTLVTAEEKAASSLGSFSRLEVERSCNEWTPSSLIITIQLVERAAETINFQWNLIVLALSVSLWDSRDCHRPRQMWILWKITGLHALLELLFAWNH